MTLPDLGALQAGDANAWDEAFRWLWPTAFAVAQLKLQPYLSNEVDDVAIEALEELVEKVRAVKSADELKPLAASIAELLICFTESRLKNKIAQCRCN